MPALAVILFLLAGCQGAGDRYGLSEFPGITATPADPHHGTRP